MRALVLLAGLLMASPALADGQPVKVTWLGHATFVVKAASGTTVVIDPFITGNPKTPAEHKDLKKLRYAADTFAPIYPDAKVATYVKELKSLQDSFGHLNDAAMAAEALTGPEAPGRDDGDVQRGVGWVLGTLTVRAGQQRPDLFARWDRLRAARPFWS